MQMNLFETDKSEKLRNTFVDDLKRGSGFEGGKLRIRNLFDQKLTKKETIERLKREYGIGGRSTMASTNGYRQRHDSKGIKITIKTGEEKQYTWSQVHDALFSLVDAGEYL